MSDLKIELGVRGRYRAIKQKGSRRTFDSGWFDNLITNQGLNFLGTSNQYLYGCHVGSSSATPAFTDVALGAFIAARTQSSSTVRIETASRYSVYACTYTFVAGSATGNISEVGVGTSTSGNTLFSRALILDSFGNPTTVTVQADEDLIIIYELWVKQPTIDYPVTVSGYALNIRACLVDSVSSMRGWGNSGDGLAFFAQNANSYHALHSGDIGEITGQPSGASAYVTGSSMVIDAYVPGTYTRAARLRWLPSEANAETWKSLSFSVGPTFWQASITPSITKTAVQSLSIKVRVVWSRDNGPS